MSSGCVKNKVSAKWSSGLFLHVFKLNDDRLGLLVHAYDPFPKLKYCLALLFRRLDMSSLTRTVDRFLKQATQSVIEDSPRSKVLAMIPLSFDV